MLDEHGARVEQMFTRIASRYDRANRWMSMGTDVRWRRRAVAELLPADAPAEPRVLDLCAGTLDSTLAIARRFPTATVIAGDFSEAMLAQGQAKLSPAEARRIRVAAMDAHELPLDDFVLDAVFCAFGIRNLTDLVRATQEQARCLRTGGVLTVLEFFRPTQAFARAFHSVYNRTMLPVVGWIATGDWDAYSYLPRSIESFVTVGGYRDLLEAHGFVDVHVEALTGGVAHIVRATRSENPEAA